MTDTLENVMQRADDAIRGGGKWYAGPVLIEDLRVLLDAVRTPAPIVMYQVRDFADGWISFRSEAGARAEAAAMGGASIRALYAAPLTSDADQT